MSERHTGASESFLFLERHPETPPQFGREEGQISDKEASKRPKDIQQVHDILRSRMSDFKRFLDSVASFLGWKNLHAT